MPGRVVDTVFFGGGTPSLMPPETVAAVIEAIRRGWSLAPDAEITLEANPTSVEAGRFRGYRDAGVNRLSMGVQALNDADLRALGRMHDTAEAVRAFEVARAIFPRVSFDLIYARQGQTLAAWRAELGRALGDGDRPPLALPAHHRGRHPLRRPRRPRPAPRPARRRRRRPTCSSPRRRSAARRGSPGYEISNHARPGAESRHNLVYWRYGDYVGVGPGAHGRLTLDGRRWAIEALRSPEAWLEAVERDGSGVSLRAAVSGPEQAVEMLMMGLRLREGVDPARFEALNGAPLPADARRASCRRSGCSRPAQAASAATGAGRPLPGRGPEAAGLA